MIWLCYVIGGVIGVLIILRFLLPSGFIDVKNSWGFFDVMKTIGYQIIKISLLSCFVFLLSWISVGYSIIHYNGLKSKIEDIKL